MIFVVVSTGHFDPLIAECSRLSAKYEFFGQIGSSTVVPPFPHFRTAEPPKIEEYMRKAELVISHGGAGMTAMLYRMKKPSVIIPKQKRYGEPNDLQIELARKWGSLKTGVLCMNVEDLQASIEQARSFQYEWPEFPRLGDYLREQLQLPKELISHTA